MEFEWDENKNRANFKKHGVRFETAVAVFDDPAELSEPAHDVDGEARTQTMGFVAGIEMLFVVHTDRRSYDGEPVVRLISARRASRKERARYDRQNPQDR